MQSCYICVASRKCHRVREIIGGFPIMLMLPLEDTPQPQGLLASLVAKIVNNLQVSVKNIHVRYEDKLSVPGVSLRLLFWVRT